MTLCIYRKRKTYFESFVVDEFEMDALVKALDAAVGALAEEGDKAAALYAGAYLAFKTMRDVAKSTGRVDMYADFITELEKAIEEMEVGA